jgi:hypothetical protein
VLSPASSGSGAKPTRPPRTEIRATLSALAALAALNLGLHLWLEPRPLKDASPLPFWDVLERPQLGWRVLQGNPKLRDGVWNATTLERVQLPLALPPNHAYRLEVRSQIRAGGTLEIGFNAQSSGSLSRSHAVRVHRADDRLRFSAIRYDRRGEFITVERATRPDDANPRLEVRVSARQFGVWQDGVLVLRAGLNDLGGIPGIALTNAALLEVRVSTVEPEAPRALPRPGLEGSPWRALRGAWRVSSGVLEQLDAATFDRAALHPHPFPSIFDLRLSLRHLEGHGAGVVLCAPSLEDVRGASLVRFSEDGTRLFWGAFDGDGRFVGRGNAVVPRRPNDRRVLEIRVEDGNYDIVLDGRRVASRVRLTSPRGHVGVTTSRSGARFERLEVSAGGERRTLLPTPRKP